MTQKGRGVPPAKPYRYLLLLWLASTACASTSDTSPDDLGGMDAAASALEFTTLSLVAGGLDAVGYQDGTGPAARFRFPSGVATDSAGNLYVADTQNHIIRKVVLSTGAVSTLAGTPGMPGVADGIGAAAQFNGPVALTVGSDGNLYIADSGNNTIRKLVLATGVVSTVAGNAGSQGSSDGLGRAAEFANPQGIATDGAGNLYVADTYNNTIRKIVLATGLVSTFAGGMMGFADGEGAAANFNTPEGLAADGAGDLYVADSWNSRIRKIVLATGLVSTLALSSGDGIGTEAGFNFPAGLVADGAGNLYVTDSASTVRKIVLGTAVVSTLCGTALRYGSMNGTGPGALFNSPFGVAVDGAGNLYIVDSGNSIIRKAVLATAAVTTLAGPAGLVGQADGPGPSAQFLVPGGVTADGAGNLYIADSGNNTIRKIVLATAEVSTLAGTPGVKGSADGQGPSAQFSSPMGLTTDGVGNLYVADSNNGTIRKIVLATAEVSHLAYLIAGVVALTADGAGTLYIADSEESVILKLDLATEELSTLAGSPGTYGSHDGTGADALFQYPLGLALDGAGNLFVADSANNIIRKIVLATGEVSTLAGTPPYDYSDNAGFADGIGVAAQFNFPMAMALDGRGSLYVADTRNATIRRIWLQTGRVTTLAGSTPHPLMFGGTNVMLGPLPAELSYPVGLTVTNTGELIIIDENFSLVLAAH
jgi:sugar lactone lactonase YvrE